MVSAFAWLMNACGANTMIPSDGAVFADEADLPACAEQPVVDKPMAAKRDKSIFFISYFVYIVLVFSFFYSFLFCLAERIAERIAEIIAERNYLKAMTLLRISFLYSFFIPSGRCPTTGLPQSRNIQCRNQAAG